MSDTIKSFRDLRVWQNAQDLCVSVYKYTDSFPQNEQFGLTSQIRRAAVSVPSNIAEGFGRRGPKEKEQFFRHSLGLLFELDTQLELALRLHYLQLDDYKTLVSEIEPTRAMLIKLLTVNNTKFVNQKS